MASKRMPRKLKKLVRLGHEVTVNCRGVYRVDGWKVNRQIKSAER